MLWATDPAVNWSPYTAKIYNDLLIYCMIIVSIRVWGGVLTELSLGHPIHKSLRVYYILN